MYRKQKAADMEREFDTMGWTSSLVGKLGLDGYMFNECLQLNQVANKDKASDSQCFPKHKAVLHLTWTGRSVFPPVPCVKVLAQISGVYQETRQQLQLLIAGEPGSAHNSFHAIDI